jgi:hypothetical protein
LIFKNGSLFAKSGKPKFHLFLVISWECFQIMIFYHLIFYFMHFDEILLGWMWHIGQLQLRELWLHIGGKI